MRVSRRDAARQARINSSRAKYRKPKKGGATSVGLDDIIGSGACWCGQPMGHDWPGKSEKEPHPR